MEFLALDNGVLERIVSLLCFDAMSPLTLTTGFFLFAFLVFGVGYVALCRCVNLRNIYVVLFSLYFYYKLSGIYVLLLLAVALGDYLIGRRVARRRERGRDTRGWVALSVTINVAILAYFMATDFFVSVVNDLFGSGTLDW
ncbi:MAG: MBOAT family protein, partial [Alistipes sp.]|nr:MBOAT family protein [Alistipes sp.]